MIRYINKYQINCFRSKEVVEIFEIINNNGVGLGGGVQKTNFRTSGFEF